MNIKKNQLIFLGVALLGLAIVAIFRHTMDDYALSIANFAGIYLILAVSLNITNGYTGLFSLGHPAFMAVGGYVTAILTLPLMKKSMFLPDLYPWLAQIELPFLPAVLIGGVIAALVSVIIGVAVLRLKGHYLAVATMGFLIIVQVMITNWDSVTRGPLGLNGLEDHTNLWWVYLFVVLTVFSAWRIKFSSFGRSMLSVREDEMASQCLGVNLFKTRVMALAIGAFFAGVAGGLWAHLITAITPGSFSLIMAFNIVVMVVVGGSGSITGCVAASFIFSLITEAFRPLEETWEVYGLGEIVMALILILILIYRPSGLMGSHEPKILTRQEK